MKSDRLTVRLKAEQMQLLRELRDKIGASCSLIVRSIILDFFSRNEQTIENIITKDLKEEEEENADYKKTAQEAKKYLSFPNR